MSSEHDPNADPAQYADEGGYDDQGGYDDDAASDVSDLDPESRILAPVQKRIETQLLGHLEQLTLEVHEAKNEARMMHQKREDCGVELYNVQQHLAKLQESFEHGHDNFVALQHLREEKESEKAHLLSEHDAVQRTHDDLKKKQVKYQVELDKLSETVIKVEQFNEQIQSEIQIERRAAYKAEDDIVKLEGQKAKQDLLVDTLNERTRALSEQQATIAAQLSAQKDETKVAKDTLGEALSEMDVIEFQKKQLMQQWKASIIGMQRRDEALRTVEEALVEQKEALMALDNEIVGYRHGIKAAQQKNAKLSHLLSKTENEVTLLESQIDQLLERKTKSTEKFNLLKRSLEQTDSENAVLQNEERVLQSEINAMAKKTQKSAKEVHDMEAKVMETLNQQTTLKKGSQAALLDIEKMKNVIRDKEMHVTQMENELARIRVDTLQTQSHNEVLQTTVSELEKELTSRDTLIEKMQVDIRRRHDEIERKQKTLDSLNRQFDGIIAAQGNEEGEHVGPLEATINNLSKAITQKSSENDSLQRDWIRLQTELVNSRTSGHKLQESIRELRAQCTILMQKRTRMLASMKKQNADMSNLEKTTAAMHLQMKRLNTLVCDNSENQELIANDNFNLENDLVKRLQERKKEAMELETRIDGIRESKGDLLAEILDAERNVMTWEKKIQIAKETEMALDPTIGKDEINDMKREIYIMEQRLGNLQREQRRKVEEMQKLIDHRDVLRTKGQAVQAASTTGQQKGVTKVTVNKENHRVAQELTAKKTEAQTKEAQIKDCVANTERTALEVERVISETDNAAAELGQVQQAIDVKTQERGRVTEEKARKQRTLNRYRDAEKGMYKLEADPDQMEQQRAAIDDKKRGLVVVLQEMASTFPQLGAELQDLQSAL
jgi:chromosome segregation ATPase